MHQDNNKQLVRQRYSTENALQPSETGKSAGLCAAFGCPLPGSICIGSTTGNTYYCRYHCRAAVEQFDAISLAINTNLPLVRHVWEMEARASDAYWLRSDEHAADRQRAYAFSALPKDAGEDHYTYVSRLRAHAIQVITSKMPERRSIAHAITTHRTGTFTTIGTLANAITTEEATT